MIRKPAFLLVLLFLILNITPVYAQTGFTQKILAVVNGEAITQTDVDEILAPIYMQYKNTYQGEELGKKLEKAKGDILNQLIEDKLILQQAIKDQLLVDPKEVDQLVNELRNNFATAEEFDTILDNQKVSLTDLRKRYEEQLLIKKAVQREILSKIIISPAEISEYYSANTEEFAIPEQIHLRNIFLTLEGKKPEEIEQKANEIYDQLQKGTEFVELVEKYSESPSVVDAGDMGFMNKGSLREEIESVVYKMDPGQITKPIKTSSGYYLFRIEDKKEATVSSLEDIQDKIKRFLYGKKLKLKFDEWLKKLKESAFIEVKANEKKES